MISHIHNEINVPLNNLKDRNLVKSLKFKFSGCVSVLIRGGYLAVQKVENS